MMYLKIITKLIDKKQKNKQKIKKDKVAINKTKLAQQLENHFQQLFYLMQTCQVLLIYMPKHVKNNTITQDDNAISGRLLRKQ